MILSGQAASGAMEETAASNLVLAIAPIDGVHGLVIRF
jgi:hypothetical protein